MSSIADNLAAVRERLAGAAARSGRQPGEIRLIAVAKTMPAAVVREAVLAGAGNIGENYIQEAEAKYPLLADLDFCRHMIGHLQRNKARRAVASFDWVQTVDSSHLAAALSRAATDGMKVLNVLIEVNIASEESKTGYRPDDVRGAAEEISQLKGLSLQGLMAIPPAVEESVARGYFRALRKLRDDTVSSTGIALPELSMGMSGDYETAVEEGATMVRIGRAIFGERR